MEVVLAIVAYAPCNLSNHVIPGYIGFMRTYCTFGDKHFIEQQRQENEIWEKALEGIQPEFQRIFLATLKFRGLKLREKKCFSYFDTLFRFDLAILF